MSKSNGEFNCILWLKLIGDFMKNRALHFLNRLFNRNFEIVLFAEGQVEPNRDFVNIKDIRYRLGAWEGESVNDDPQIYLYNKAEEPLDSRKYRFIKFSLFSSHSAKGQFIWWLSDGRWQTSRNFSISKGWEDYCFDMRTIPTYGTFAGSGVGWEGLIGKLRLDPAEETKVSLKIRNLKLTTMLEETISPMFNPLRDELLNVKQNNDDCKILPIVVKSNPILIYAEISTKCNLRCRMCGRAHYDILSSSQGFMNREVFEKLARLFTPGVQLALFGRGESLMHPDLIYFLELANNKGARVSFNTNGLMLTEVIAKAMVEYAQSDVTFSCSAGTPETYCKIHGVNAWQKLWDNIEVLNEAKLKYGAATYNGIIGHIRPVIYIEFVSQLSNISELPVLLRKAFEYNVMGLVVVDLVAHSKEMEAERMNLPETIPIAEKYYTETLALYRDLIKSKNPNFDLRLPNSYSPITKKYINESEKDRLDEITVQLNNSEAEFTERHFCLESWRTFYVRFDGTVAPCVITGRSLGDLNKASAEEIWNGEIYQKFRGRMKGTNKPYECLRCHLFPGPKRYDKGLDNVVDYESL